MIQILHTLAWRRGAVVAVVTNVLAGFVAPADAATETVLHSFQNNGTDGVSPAARPINVSGTLYGTTQVGGTNSDGAIFSIDPTTGAETALYSFQNNGLDGISPVANLIKVKGTLYGTTYGGGTSGAGTVFSITPGGKENVLYSFQNNGTDSFSPEAGLISVGGKLYGTTIGGGTHGGGGTVFSITPRGEESVLHSFGNGTDGAEPRASLIDVNGTLYGTTYAGGVNHAGTIFSITPLGKERVFYAFKNNGSDGVSPVASLINIAGTLYGTTEVGGTNNAGTVFSITSGGKEKVLYSFQNNGSDGFKPVASLLNVGGKLYGTTFEGGGTGCGGPGCGTVFSITSRGKESVLHSFQSDGADGINPVASLINVSGTLYGTTYAGGTNGDGTVFSITP
ncbi:MAG TPA: choice-of-anchor tandem repeat GloVer-containing protein [Rhizomicrobium sp.]|jgi:uncharacterized repeat protein (TIGR03803 family)